MFFERQLNLPKLLRSKSYFLFGPRATGKSSLVRHQFPGNIPIINLLRSEVYLELSAKPYRLESMIKIHLPCELVVIDEVQRVPELLNEVHRLIEEQGLTFLLTGSSARKLRQKSVNLLAGRAREARLFPLTSVEIPEFDLNRYLKYGGLPVVYLSDEPEEDLYAYIDTYLKEEIQAESLVRNIPGFSRFLQTAALTSGHILNFTQIGSDVGLPASTVREYYYLLEDTFVGFMVPAYTKTRKRKAMSTAKFYFFDIGVRNALLDLGSVPFQTEVYGLAFEHFIAMELRAYLSYRRIRKPLQYWRAKHGQEVDFIIGDELAVEVKSTAQFKDKHGKGLQAFAEEEICKRHILISHDPISRKLGRIETLHWRIFLEKLWGDEFFGA